MHYQTKNFNFLQISFIAFVTIEIKLGMNTTDEVIDLIEMEKFGVIATLKVFLLRFYSKNVAQIISSVNNDSPLLKELKYRKIMKTYANIGNFVFYAQTFSTASIISLQVISSLSFFQPTIEINLHNNSQIIIYGRGFPLKTKYLFSDVSTISYILIIILQTIQLISTAFGNIGIDIFFFNLSMQICGRLEILCEQISQLQENNDFKVTKFRIIELVKRHQDLWIEAQTLEKTFNSTILMQLAINITGICAYGKFRS